MAIKFLLVHKRTRSTVHGVLTDTHVSVCNTVEEMSTRTLHMSDVVYRIDDTVLDLSSEDAIMDFLNNADAMTPGRYEMGKLFAQGMLS